MRSLESSKQSWHAANREARRALGLDKQLNDEVYVFPNLPLAMLELTQSLQENYPHKIGVSYWQTGGNLFEDTVRLLSAQGAIGHLLSLAEVLSPTEWFAQSQRDLLLTLECVDDPVSSEPLQSESFDRILKDQRVFRIKVHNFAANYWPHLKFDSITPHSISLFVIDDSLCVAVCGSRVKIEIQYASRLRWGSLTADEIQCRGQFKTEADLQNEFSVLQSFSSNIPKGSFLVPPSPLFNSCKKSRAHILIYFLDLDSSALISQLPSKLQKGFLSGSFCRTGSDKVLQSFLHERGLPPEAARGLLAIPPEFAARPDAVPLLEGARQKILQLQEG